MYLVEGIKIKLKINRFMKYFFRVNFYFFKMKKIKKT